MTTDEADSKNVAIRRQALLDLKQIMSDMMEMDADQIMWNHVSNIAICASAIQDEMNGTVTEEE